MFVCLFVLFFFFFDRLDIERKKKVMLKNLFRVPRDDTQESFRRDLNIPDTSHSLLPFLLLREKLRLPCRISTTHDFPCFHQDILPERFHSPSCDDFRTLAGLDVDLSRARQEKATQSRKSKKKKLEVSNEMHQ